VKKKICRFILLDIIGWKIEGNKTLSKETINKAIIIAAPHTHWLDLFLGILIRGAINFNSNFIAKKELFFFPLNIFLKLLGGVPVDRSKKSNIVTAIANIYKEKKEFRISLAPEGTRKKVDKFRTGFYYIAKEADIPIIMITMDYLNKISRVSEPFYITNDLDNDFNYIEGYFDGVVGKIKEYSFYKK
tara:strand:- start:161 stop:724 length:564 start_codon:yes stop_codon:yes gene_type:complete